MVRVEPRVTETARFGNGNGIRQNADLVRFTSRRNTGWLATDPVRALSFRLDWDEGRLAWGLKGHTLRNHADMPGGHSTCLEHLITQKTLDSCYFDVSFL